MKWPVNFEIADGGPGNRTASSVGHGWSTFLADQDVKEGSLLLFEVVDTSCLVVTVTHHESPRKPQVEGCSKLQRRRSDGPVFEKTLRASHLGNGGTSRLVCSVHLLLYLFMPWVLVSIIRSSLNFLTSRPGFLPQDFPAPYCRQFPLEHFKDTWFTLSGPLAAVRVKSTVHVNPRQTFCYLSKGWSEFVALNDLKLGDTITFAAVGTQEFNVDRS